MNSNIERYLDDKYMISYYTMLEKAEDSLTALRMPSTF